MSVAEWIEREDTVFPLVHCAHCGAELPMGAVDCPACGWLLVAPRGAIQAGLPMRGVSPASTGRVVGMIGLDVLSVLVFGAAITAMMWGITTLAGTRSTIPSKQEITIGVVAAVAGIMVAVWAYSRWGRALGGVLLRVRVVDKEGLPPSLPRPGRLHAANLSAGRDPVNRCLPDWDGDDLPSVTTPGPTRRVVASWRAIRHVVPTNAPVGAVVLVFESGRVAWFQGVCVLGRNPVAQPGMGVIALPDIARELAGEHLRIEGRDGHLWLQDLSEGGSWLQHMDGTETPISVTEATVDPGAIIRIGTARFRVSLAGDRASSVQPDSMSDVGGGNGQDW